MADTEDLKSSFERSAGSSPAPGTIGFICLLFCVNESSVTSEKMDYRYNTDKLRNLLNSQDLTDSDELRACYEIFLEQNNSCSIRLAECSKLLKSQNRQDALALAMREPELFGMAEYLLFPERKLLSRIVFLYNWKMFNEITHQQTAELRDMLNGKSDDMSASTPEYSVPAGSTIASEFPRELVDEDIDDEDDVDIRQENGRVKSLKRTLKILFYALLAVMVFGGTLMVMQSLEKRQYDRNLISKLHNAFVRSDMESAKKILAVISGKHPELLKHPVVVKAQSSIAKAEKLERDRIYAVNRTIKQLENIKSQWHPGVRVDKYFVRLAGLVRNDVEKMKLETLRDWFRIAEENHQASMRHFYSEKISGLRACRERVLSHIINSEFEQAALEFRELAENARKLKGSDIKKYAAKEDIELLNSVSELSKLISNAKRWEHLFFDNTSAFTVSDLDMLEEELKKLAGASANSFNNTTSHCAALLRETALLKRIINGQKNLSTTPSDFALVREYNTFISAQRDRERAEKRLRESFAKLHSEFENNQLGFIRMKEELSGENIDIYVSGSNILEIDNELHFRTENGTPVKIVRVGRNFYVYTVVVGKRKFNRCALAYPATLNKNILKISRARHQTFAEFILNSTDGLSQAELIPKTIEFMEMIFKDTLCAPYWKIALSAAMLQNAKMAEVTSDRKISAMYDELEALRKNPDRKLIADYISKVAFPSLYEHAKNNQLQYELMEKASKLRYRFFGISFKDNIRQLSEMSSYSGDVFCFDESGRGCVKFGSVVDGKLKISGRFEFSPGTRILFVFAPAVKLPELHKEVTEKISGSNFKLRWPAFLPVAEVIK